MPGKLLVAGNAHLKTKKKPTEPKTWTTKKNHVDADDEDEDVDDEDEDVHDEHLDDEDVDVTDDDDEEERWENLLQQESKGSLLEEEAASEEESEEVGCIIMDGGEIWAAHMSNSKPHHNLHHQPSSHSAHLGV